MSTSEQEIASGDRFEFGRNWSRFLANLTDEHIERAVESLRNYFGVTTLEGKRFLDIGSGSGLFSLAAMRLGAKFVHSFDYDAFSYACTQEMRRRYFPDSPRWKVEQGSVLDTNYLQSIGKFDVVYSWGVLHHTGDMWRAIENALIPLEANGTFLIAIYNDQGRASKYWLGVKRAYNHLPPALRFLVLAPTTVQLWAPAMIRDLLIGKPFQSWRSYGRERGMTPWIDVVDWVGGLPFEVAKPEQIFEFLSQRGLTLKKLTTCAGRNGCNEYVFERRVNQR